MSTRPLTQLPVRAPKSPNLPLAPQQFDPRYQNQLNSVLRLYFEQIDNLNAEYSSGKFGEHIYNPHIAAQYNGVQYATADNTPTVVQWDTLDSGYAFTLNPANYAIPEYDGVYKIDFSLQFANTNNAAHDAIVWLRIDGVDVVGSTSKFTLPARKSVGVYSYIVAYSSITFVIQEGQRIELMWGTDQRYFPATSDGVFMYYEAAQTTPMAYPFVPSAIGSIVFVSAIP